MTGEWGGATSEFNGGVRRYWGADSTMRPHCGGGLAFINAALEAQTGAFNYVRDSDCGAGLWFSSGVVWTLAGNFNIGFDVRLSGPEVNLFEQTRKAGGFHSAMIPGYRW